MKIIGISRVRNESKIIKNTLDHVSNLLDSIYIYDDCSTDNTVQICEAHPKVKKVLKGSNWVKTPEERRKAEGTLRQKVYLESIKEKPDWIYCFDADEYAYFEDIDFSADAYKLKLFDYYITEEDKEKNYLERQYLGREYREILMLFRFSPEIIFTQREPTLPLNYKIKCQGSVKHYGKAISIEEWEETCNYYINHRGGEVFTNFTKKWKKRCGKAIHKLSDFDTELIQWEERYKKGYLLKE